MSSKPCPVTHPVVVDDLGDNGELALGGALVDEDDAADLDVSLEGLGTHCEN